MFGQYPYIGKQHHVALESTIRNHSVTSSINAQLLAKMYRLALDGLQKPLTQTSFFTSTLHAGTVVLSSVTDIKSGLWLQLAKVENQPDPYLTVGQKWAQETLLPALGNTSTVFW